MKQKLVIAWASMLLLLGGSSCNNWLELHPENEIVLEEYWTTESEVESVLMACYRALISDGCMSRMMAWGELRSDNFALGQSVSYEIDRVLKQEITETTSFTSWGSLYEVINYCNTVIYYAPGVLEKDDNFSQGKMLSLCAEAYTLRALAYFYLVRAFKDVPWVTLPSLNDEQDYQVPQCSEKEVIDSILYDLEHKALPYARESFETTKKSKGRVTKQAVNALLADIYLWDMQYDKCIAACQRILDDETLKLENAENVLFNVFYRGFSEESIFELGFDENVQRNNTVRSWYGWLNNMNGQLSFPVALVTGTYSIFSVGTQKEADKDQDYRFKDSFTSSAGSEGYPIFKYAGLDRSENNQGVSSYSYRSTTPNWIVYRLPDVILMQAEAILADATRESAEDSIGHNPELEHKVQKVMQLVNQTYTRSNPNADSLMLANYPTVADLSDLVLRERQRELMFEGKRWFDLMRLARRAGDPGPLIAHIVKVKTGAEGIGKMSSLNALYWPINKYELEANEQLVQNPFYQSELSKPGKK